MSLTYDQLIHERAAELGLYPLQRFFDKYAGEPYGKLLKIIAHPNPGNRGYDIPILYIRKIHRKIAIKNTGEKAFAFDALTRSLRGSLGQGWSLGKKSAERRAKAFAEWNSVERECESLYLAIWKRLSSIPPPPDWRPDAVNDQLLVGVFDEIWPKGSGGG